MLAGWVLTGLLAACAPQPRPPAPPADGAAMPEAWLAEAGAGYALDDRLSRILIGVYRDGRLARLGHNHLIEVVGLHGRLTRLAGGGGIADLRIPVAALRVDEPAARARAGEAFAQATDASAVQGTRRNMLGPGVLDAQAWPEIRVLARVDALTAQTASADIHLTLRGSARRYRIPVTIGPEGDGIAVSGQLVVRQSDFGITPYAVLGGALQVRDEVTIDFRIVGRTSGRAL